MAAMATHLNDIKIKSTTDEGVTFIRSFAIMSSNRLLIADRTNETVKLVDTDSDTLKSEISLSGEPWQVARIGVTEGAVTVPDEKKIVRLQTEPELTVVKEMSVSGKCCGIAYGDNRLIVTYRAGHVEIMDTSGLVLKTIGKDAIGKRMLRSRHYVTTSPDNTSVYLSDWETKSVIRLSLEGRTLATYKGDGNWNPGQVAVSCHGDVYVGWSENISFKWSGAGWVDQLTEDCDKSGTIITGLKDMRALSFEEETQRLYVGDQSVVKVFKLS